MLLREEESLDVQEKDELLETAQDPPHAAEDERVVSLRLFGLELKLGNLAYVSAAVGFSVSASLLAVVNKWALGVFPYPALLSALQYFTSVVTVLLLGALRFLEHDAITIEKMRDFFPAAFVFYLSIFTNMHLLQVANVDTMIVFRSCTPLLVALADHYFRGQPWPSNAVLCSLFVILQGALGYVALDRHFSVGAYSWAVAYLVVITTDMVYIKHLVSRVQLNTWGLVLYNNLLSLLIFPLFFLLMGETSLLSSLSSTSEPWSFGLAFPVLLSCTLGVAISFFAFACRRALSATAFTVLGTSNKFITLTVNTLAWDKHASPGGICFLLMTVLGGVGYQQATLLLPSPEKESTQGSDEVPRIGEGKGEETGLMRRVGDADVETTEQRNGTE